MPIGKVSSLSIALGDFWLRTGSGLPESTWELGVKCLARSLEERPIVLSATQLSGTAGRDRKCV